MWLTPVENSIAVALSLLAPLIGALVLAICAWITWSLLQIAIEPPLARAFRSAQVRMSVIPEEISDPAISALIGMPVQDAFRIGARSGFECQVRGSSYDCRRKVGWIVCGENWQIHMETSGGAVTATQARKEVVCI